MRWLLIVVGLCLALTVLRAALAVLLIAWLLLVLWGILFKPAETFGLLALLMFGAVLQTHTVAVLLIVGFLACVALVGRPDQPHPPSNAKLLAGRTKPGSPDR
jgi:hypothetical protein